MRNFGLILITISFLFACNQTAIKQDVNQDGNKEETFKAPVKDGMFIHISEGYEDPHRALMPLKMALMMSDDKDVLVYMDIHAVELLVKDSKDLEYKGFESAHTYLKKLVEKNVGVYACPTCLKVAGYSPEDLLEGIQTAQKDKFFNFTEGKIISLDY